MSTAQNSTDVPEELNVSADELFAAANILLAQQPELPVLQPSAVNQNFSNSQDFELRFNRFLQTFEFIEIDRIKDVKRWYSLLTRFIARIVPDENNNAALSKISTSLNLKKAHSVIGNLIKESKTEAIFINKLIEKQKLKATYSRLQGLLDSNSPFMLLYSYLRFLKNNIENVIGSRTGLNKTKDIYDEVQLLLQNQIPEFMYTTLLQTKNRSRNRNRTNTYFAVVTDKISLKDTGNETIHLNEMVILFEINSFLLDGMLVYPMTPVYTRVGSGHFHPHVSNDHVLCFGAGLDAAELVSSSGHLIDLLLLIFGVLTNYNANSPYAPLEDWFLSDEEDENENDYSSCSICEDTYESDSSTWVYCDNCHRTVCENCGIFCEFCEFGYCTACGAVGRCARCNSQSCLNCCRQCSNCGNTVCAYCQVTTEQPACTCLTCQERADGSSS